MGINRQYILRRSALVAALGLTGALVATPIAGASAATADDPARQVILTENYEAPGSGELPQSLARHGTGSEAHSGNGYAILGYSPKYTGQEIAHAKLFPIYSPSIPQGKKATVTFYVRTKITGTPKNPNDTIDVRWNDDSKTLKLKATDLQGGYHKVTYELEPVTSGWAGLMIRGTDDPAIETHVDDLVVTAG